MPIHEKLRKLRLAKDLSQLMIAANLNISQNAYSLIENGKTKIDEQRIFQLAKILDVHPFELLTDDATNLPFNDKVSNEYYNYIQTLNANNQDQISQLNIQLAQKDKQIQKLLTQIERLSVLLDLSQKTDLLVYYK